MVPLSESDLVGTLAHRTSADTVPLIILLNFNICCIGLLHFLALHTPCTIIPQQTILLEAEAADKGRWPGECLHLALCCHLLSVVVLLGGCIVSIDNHICFVDRHAEKMVANCTGLFVMFLFKELDGVLNAITSHLLIERG